MFYMETTALGREIQKHLTRLEWSQRDLASNSGITSSAISKIVRGKSNPTPDTLKAIGDTLGLELSYLMRLMGLPVLTGNIDPSIAYIAQRMSDLPGNYRELAIDALGAQLDVIYELYKTHRELETKLRALPQNTPKNGSEGAQRGSENAQSALDREIYKAVSPAFQRTLDLLEEERPEAYEDLMQELRAEAARQMRTGVRELAGIAFAGTSK